MSQCEVYEFEPHFNMHLKYWQEWYNKCNNLWGTIYNWISNEVRYIKMPIDMLYKYS